MTKLFAAIAAILVCCAAPAARAADPEPARQQQQGVPQPADQAQPSPHKIELARQVIAAVGMDRTFQAVFQMVVDQFTASANTGPTVASSRTAAAMKGAMDDEVQKMVPRMMDFAASLYARDLTEQELTDLLTFYNSPSGRSILAKTPRILKETQAGITPMIPAMQREMADDFCERLACTPPMKAAIAARMAGAQPAN